MPHKFLVSLPETTPGRAVKAHLTFSLTLMLTKLERRVFSDCQGYCVILVLFDCWEV